MTGGIPLELAGQRQGTWTAVRVSSRGRGNWRWLIQCDCGRQKDISTTNWRRGSGTRTCQCQPKQPNYNQLPEGEASFRLLYASYVRKAAQRGIKFDLTTDEFRSLTKQPCTYCGKPPSQRRQTQTGTPYAYTGVDRVDSSIGYVAGNVAPCCSYCNRAKSDLTLDEWKAHIQTLWERLCSQ